MPNLHPWYSQIPAAAPWGGGGFYEPHVAEAIFNQFVLEESANLKVILRHELKKAVVEHNKLTAVLFEQRDKRGQFLRVQAEVTIDATYEGDVAGLAGAQFRLGRESREEFREPHAGKIYMRFGSDEPQPGSTGEGDRAIQSFCFRFSATADPANQVAVEKPRGYNRADYEVLLNDIRGGKLTNLGQVFGIFKCRTARQGWPLKTFLDKDILYASHCNPCRAVFLVDRQTAESTLQARTSGNPKGRPKGKLDMITTTLRVMHEKILITIGDRPTKITALENLDGQHSCGDGDRISKTTS